MLDNHKTTNTRIFTLGVLAAAGLALSVPAAHAGAIASDNAGNYPTGVSTGATGGYGFGSWTLLQTDNNSPPYAGEYTDGNSKPIATGTLSWGVYANGGSTTATPRIDMFRPFNSALASGQTFSVALESDSVGADVYGYVPTGSTTGTPGPATYHQNGLPAYGFSLQTGNSTAVTAGTTSLSVANPFTTPTGSASYNVNSYTNPNALFTVSFTELGPGETLNGQSNPDTTTSGGYVLQANITDASGPHSFLSSASSNAINESMLSGGVTAAFALDSGNTYSLTLSSVGTTPTVLGTYTGSINGTINAVDLFNQATSQNGYFNNLNIAATTAVPEPGTVGLFIAAGAGLLLIRRRVCH